MVDLVHTEQSINESEFFDFERKFTRKIPDSFRRHYMFSNGGFPSETDVEAGKWGLPVNGFYSIKYGNMTIEKMVEYCEDITPGDEKFGPWKKFDFIPFAYDSGGNVIFMSLMDDDFGSIYLYAQDGENIFMISPSFEIFRSKLYMIGP